MNNQLVADLKASKAELERRGWTKSTLVKADGKVCALGAVGCALVPNYATLEFEGGLYGPFNTHPRARAVVKALARLVDDKPEGYDHIDLVYHKNDRADTTLQDVYDLFDKALAEEGGLA